MRNDEFQRIIRKGDTFEIQEENTREIGGKQFKFIRFTSCQHMTNPTCKYCRGQIVYENRESYKGFSSEGCQREFNDPDKQDYLVVKVDIIPGPEWISDKEWEII